MGKTFTDLPRRLYCVKEPETLQLERVLLSLGVTTIITTFILPPFCVIRACPCHLSLDLLFSKGGEGICNLRNDLSARCAHEGETDADRVESAKEFARRDRHGQ